MAQQSLYCNYFENDFKVMALLGGLWPFESFIHYNVYRKIRNVVLLISITLPIGTLINLLKAQDLKQFLEGYYMFLLVLSCVLKCCHTIKDRNEFRELFKVMTTDPAFEIQNDEEQKIAEKNLKFYKILKNIMLYFDFVVLWLTAFLCFEKSQYLPIPCWYPFDVFVSPFNEIAFIHQVISCGCLASCYMAEEIILVGLTTFIGMQCDLICYRLKNLNPDQESLKKIVNHHRSILRFAKATENIFSTVYMVNFGICIGTVPVTLFLLSQVIESKSEFVMYLFDLLATMGLFLLNCWFSSEMTRKSESIPVAAFETAWVDSSNSFKKDLSFFIHCTQNPIRLQSLGLFEISLATFMSIARTSFSYYTVLNTIGKKYF